MHDTRTNLTKPKCSYNMPNHIQNRLIIHAEGRDLDTVLITIGTHERKIDFERIIHPPDNLFRDSLSHEKELELNAAGIPHWYGWNRANWGTKWNAYELDDPRNLVKNEVWFQTAWNTPVPIIEKIAEIFPNIKMNFSYADENTGYNTGRAILQNGVCHWIDIEGGSTEAYELCFDLYPEDKERYILKDDGSGNLKYEYIDED